MAKRKSKRNSVLITILIVVLVLAIAGAACWYFFVYRTKQQPGGDISGGTTSTDPSSGSSSTDPSGGSSSTDPSGGSSSTDPSGGSSSTDPSGGETATCAELSIHFLELGNKYAGDCIYIQCGDVDVLIDGGSRENSANTIEKYVDTYCTDGVLEYVIVTHGHQDHIAAFAGNSSYKSLFERYECETIIDFPLTNSTSKTYDRYVAARDAEVKAGAVHYNALQCYNNTDGAQRSYSLGEGVSMNFLYNYYYDHKTDNENNYSVCMYIQQGEYNYLFTGDLEGEGEEYLVQYNELPQCKLYKAGHHGSKTSSSEALLSVIKPEYVCVCCCAGSPEYTSNSNNTFPTRAALQRIMKYTDNVYVTTLATDVSGKSWNYTSMNGNIVVKSNGVDFSLTGSNNSVKLKDTEWYQQNRA